MVTAQDVHTVTFDKGMRGYHTEQVDQFLDQVASQIEQDAQTIADLNKENAALKEKLYLLAQKIEEYRADEDNLKSALLNAQRMGENVVREAKQKADAIEREAKIRADNTVSGAAARCREEEIEYDRIRAEVSQFKANVLDLYRQHIESLSTLPEYGTEHAADDAKEKDAAEVQPEETAAAAPAAQEEAPAASAETAPETLPLAEEPAAEKPAAPVEPSLADFWEKDESELAKNTPQPEEKPSVLDTFHGIRFSD